MTGLDYDSLPAKRMGSGCLLFDANGDVLLVKPTYKPGWEIPGGVVERGESPRQCCEREVKEELALDRSIERLLLVDYNGPTADRTESLMFVFHGGVLTPAEISQIRLPPEELETYQFCSKDALPPDLDPPLRDRVLRAWQQIDEPGPIYVENLP